MSSDLDAHQPEAKQRASRAVSRRGASAGHGPFRRGQGGCWSACGWSPPRPSSTTSWAFATRRLGDAGRRRAQLFSRRCPSIPTYAPAHSNMGSLHLEAGRLDDAWPPIWRRCGTIPTTTSPTTTWASVPAQGKDQRGRQPLKRANRLEKAAHAGPGAPRAGRRAVCTARGFGCWQPSSSSCCCAERPRVAASVSFSSALGV